MAESQTPEEYSLHDVRFTERIELALEGSKTSVLDWDIEHNHIYISPSWKKMLGYTDDELPNAISSWAKLVHREDQKKILLTLKLQQKRQVKYFENTHRLKHKDGHWVWVLGRAQIQYNEAGNKVRMIGTHTDITEEKELQLKYLYQSEMIEQINDSVTTTDLKGKIVSWNAGSERTFGYTAEEVIGKNISLLYPEEDLHTLENYAEVLKTKGIHSADVCLVKKDKTRIPISYSLTLMRNAQGIPIGIVGINKDNTKRKEVEDALFEQKEKLHFQAHHDALTGLANRLLFSENLDEAIVEAKAQKSAFALFFIDLDGFKDINDSLGHKVGDDVLKIVSTRLKGVLGKKDKLARLSGDEFTIILKHFSSLNDASILAEKVLKVLAEPMLVDDNCLYVSGSIGVTLYPEHALSAENLLKYADTAMYEAKADGRNTYIFYNQEMTEIALAHMDMKNALRTAIDNEEFIIHYQPQINTLSKSMVGVEALIRWKHPTKGIFSPSHFITLAEETGMVVEIDRWMMKKAMKQVRAWYEEGLSPGTLALNISIRHLESPDFIDELKANMKTYSFESGWLELEITEGQMIRKTEEVIQKLHEINDLGIMISIDDFGTGYSSLSLLKRLPIRRLKIDKSFISDIPRDSDDIAIVEAIIALGKSLKLELIAEGVETEEQKDFLLSHGCHHVQGFYYSAPVMADIIRETWLDCKVTE
ncbi:MAG: EAL domain-containing protein [Sulfurovum sp.]|nr:EAL domain-containing protein [Sulfurovum sp.]